MTATWWRWVSDLWWEEEEYTRHHGITTNYTPLLILGRSTLIGRGQQRYCALIGWFSVFVLGVLTLVCVVVTVLRLARINRLSQVSFQTVLLEETSPLEVHNMALKLKTILCCLFILWARTCMERIWMSSLERREFCLLKFPCLVLSVSVSQQYPPLSRRQWQA